MVTRNSRIDRIRRCMNDPSYVEKLTDDEVKRITDLINSPVKRVARKILETDWGEERSAWFNGTDQWR